MTHGQMLDADVVRARVRSREQLSYEQAQAEIDGAAPREVLRLLAEVGIWRESRERDRGGVSLQIPDQEVRKTAGGLDAGAIGPICRWRAGTPRSRCSRGWRRPT